MSDKTKILGVRNGLKLSKLGSTQPHCLHRGEHSSSHRLSMQFLTVLSTRTYIQNVETFPPEMEREHWLCYFRSPLYYTSCSYIRYSTSSLWIQCLRNEMPDGWQANWSSFSTQHSLCDSHQKYLTYSAIAAVSQLRSITSTPTRFLLSLFSLKNFTTALSDSQSGLASSPESLGS